jgi:C1A family cysteine protease
MGKKSVFNTLILSVGLRVVINSVSPSLVSQQTIQYNDKTIESNDNLPPSFSWRDVDGVDYTTPVKSQIPCPSCEAYGVVAALETFRNASFLLFRWYM